MPSGKTERYANVGVAILAKAPLAGFAKTRLIPRLGAEGAAALQRWLLQRTVATALSAGIGPVTLWCAPDTAHPDFAMCCTFGPLALRRQPEGNLGERMLAAIAGASTLHGTLVIGTDCPALTPTLLRQAANALAGHDAAVVPAEDGGYVLIGMRQAAPRIFDAIDWSTGRVMAQTRERLAAIGWRWQEFAPLWDVDRGEDLDRLNASFPAGMEQEGA
ncbi:MAG: TIGR04282 family arsenosugar biosynthesis glycosyltransferase [Azonexus sp.]|jgi:rSAM/selenodomain-associated transferase 1|nr:TIGR04282 family arsenosugar biosynthesis glycosyltransferase [Azonexus sp.]